MQKKNEKVKSNMNNSIAVSQRSCIREERHTDKSINRKDKQGNMNSSISSDNLIVKPVPPMHVTVFFH